MIEESKSYSKIKVRNKLKLYFSILKYLRCFIDFIVYCLGFRKILEDFVNLKEY